MASVKKDNLDMSNRKLDLSLSLTPSPFKNPFIDDTPTPSRFLQALESEFQEDNPFDATFRKANSSIHPHSLILPESSSLISCLPDSEVLNTPSITLPSEPSTPLILKAFAKKSDKILAYSENTMDTLPFTPEGQSSRENASSELSEEESFHMVSHEQVIIPDQEVRSEKVVKIHTNVMQTPVITSVGNSERPTATGVPTAVVVTRPTSIVRNIAPVQLPVVTEKPSPAKVAEQPPAVVQSVCVTPMVQVMIRLPDGQTMPVQFPVMTSVPVSCATGSVPIAPAVTVKNSAAAAKTKGVSQNSIISSVTPLIQTVSSSESQVSTSVLNTKMKLKEVLKQNQKTTPPKSNIPTEKVVESVSRSPSLLQAEELLAQFGISPPHSPTSSGKSSGRKRREYSDNPDEKRRKSLERNRAAATRCREKRKQWITALERKADELADVNVHMQCEVTQLRHEVAQLKRMLLAHKDCPVTLQQKSLPYDSEKDAYPCSLHLAAPSPDDLQRVPTSTVSPPLNPSDYIEMEMSSGQSGSDASLASSDNSEASFKER